MGMNLPQAHVVRQGGQQFSRPPAPPVQREPGAIQEQLRTALAVAIGMWPLTGVLLFALAMLWVVGMSGSP